MSLKEIKKIINELVEIRITVAKQSNNMLYKKDILDKIDLAIDNMKLQEKDEVYRLYLIEQRMKG